jgi:hypothetical protein
MEGEKETIIVLQEEEIFSGDYVKILRQLEPTQYKNTLH